MNMHEDIYYDASNIKNYIDGVYSVSADNEGDVAHVISFRSIEGLLSAMEKNVSKYEEECKPKFYRRAMRQYKKAKKRKRFSQYATEFENLYKRLTAQKKRCEEKSKTSPAEQEAKEEKEMKELEKQTQEALRKMGGEGEDQQSSGGTPTWLWIVIGIVILAIIGGAIYFFMKRKQ